MQTLHPNGSPRLATQGFTLIKLLVSVMIFAIGMLGLSNLQVQGLRSNQMSFMRSQAISLAYSMADRMRANPVAALAGDYDGSPAISATNCVGTGHTCLPAAMANYDQNAWLTAIDILPNGSGSVTNNGSGSFTLTVRWDEERSGATGTHCPPQSANNLRCYPFDLLL